METFQVFLSYLLHIDTYLLAFVATYGQWTYFVLFLIIFCETGLVIMPFLPGDSLLFTAGSIAAQPSKPLDIGFLFLLLFLASVLGNKVNYLFGRFIGPKVLSTPTYAKWINRQYLERTHQFYEKHGGKTLILARFIPIVRTFAPFVAGVSYMSTAKFTLFNLVSALLWIGSLLLAGYLFGTHPFVAEHFSFFIYGIVLISLAPPTFGFILHRYKSH